MLPKSCIGFIPCLHVGGHLTECEGGRQVLPKSGRGFNPCLHVSRHLDLSEGGRRVLPKSGLASPWPVAYGRVTARNGKLS